MRIALSSLLAAVIAASASAGELKFKKHVLSTVFYSEGCAVGDVNQDGRIDVLAGPFWYEAPAANDKWRPHAIFPAGNYNYAGGYSESFINAAGDVNLDGWIDLMVIGFPGTTSHWYENPQGKDEQWKQHEMAAFACGETPWFGDLDGNGRMDLLAGFKPGSQERGWMIWWESPTQQNDLRWKLHAISQSAAPGTHHFAHGLGVGDMNKDGRNDVLIKEGWWEAPDDPKQSPWTFHPSALGEDCADMHVYDVDDDGDMDVISSSAHKYGIWWHEQGRDAEGKVTWTTHTIHDKLSQTHAIHLIDMNGDKMPDLVTGKRFYAHNGHDPGGKDAAILMWLEFSREGKSPKWTPHVIDDDSGVGTQFIVQDITGDGKLDIVTSNKKGTFVFLNIAQ